MAYGKIKADTLVYDNSGSDVEVTLSSLGNKAGLASPTFTGTVTIPTPATGDNSTKAASTAFVHAAGYAPLASPTFTGTVNAAALTLSGNLVVNGSTTTVSSTTIEVADKNLELGKVSTPTDISADGGGITLRGGTDKTFNWVNATDSWTSSESIHLGDAKKIYFGTGQDFLIEHNGTSGFVWNTTGDTILRGSGNGWITIQPKSGEAGIVVKPDNATELYYDNSKKIETTAAGVTVTGEVRDSKGDVRTAPREDKTANYTLVASDAGKCITSTHQVTIPSGVLSATYNGDIVTIINNSGSDITIVQGSGLTMYNAADASTGNRTLAQRGMATLYFVNTNVTHISGAGLS